MSLEQKIISMKEQNFLPVGFQYYRAPTPHRKNWEKDLKKISDDGFNVVKYWVQWRSNQPREIGYDFSDIDELMDLAALNGLKVILNLILDVAPAWFYKKYPDSIMETNCGEKLMPSAVLCRQIGGGPGPCFHHDMANTLREEFCKAAAARYANHPAMFCWDLWNEPELTVFIRRDAIVKDLVCYCENSIAKFSLYLTDKYQSIEKLNDS